jgi:hydroxymethylbilane synthase
LALAQVDVVARLLEADVEPVVTETAGDRRGDVQIWEMGGSGVFVKEVQAAVLEGRADFAVHSAKDLPSAPAEGLHIAAVPGREDARDALVGAALHDLGPGARVGTGAVRRRAQLAWHRPDLTFGSLRGNVDTRLARASSYDAIVVAMAALRRLGRESAAAEVLDVRWFVPQVGQGALAVECRADDAAMTKRLATVDHRPSRLAVEAERAWLRGVGGGCDLPVGAHATVDGDGAITLTAMLARADGRILLRHRDSGQDPERLGQEVAWHLLDGAGGRMLLEPLAPALPDRTPVGATPGGGT